MKAFFYFPINVDIYPDSSIVKKNKHIISSAKRLGIETDVISFSHAGTHLNERLLEKGSNSRIVRGLHNQIFAYQTIIRKCDFNKYDFAWIRVVLFVPPLLSFIKAIKKQNPNIKIILEYGSYPFKDELVGYQKLLFPVSEYSSKYLKNYASRVITYCGQDEIYNIPNIKIGNGIDVRQIEWNPHPKALTDKLHLVSVSGLMNWHACDRVITGMKNYYIDGKQENKIDVCFHIVGEGPEKANLEKMVAAAHLEDKVIFHGFKTKAELNEVFNECHLALGSLGAHRKNLTADSALKNREYFARGLPFVLAMNDADFPAHLPFVKYVAGDESPIDIASLIEFYKNIAERYPDYPALIRKYAEENLTWDSKIRQVLSSLYNGVSSSAAK